MWLSIRLYDARAQKLTGICSVHPILTAHMTVYFMTYNLVYMTIHIQVNV